MKILFTLSLLFTLLYSHAQVSVKTFGARGDGATDDGPAIQDALNSGNSTVYFEAGKVYITSDVLIVPSNVTVVGNGATLKPNSSFTKYAFPVITTSNKSDYTATGLSISVKKGVSTFSYSKASSLTVGSLLYLEGPEYGTNGYEYGWYGTITAISGSTVTMNTPATDTYTAKELTQYITTKNVAIKSLNVNLKGRTTGFGVGITNAVNSSISSCFVESDGNSTCSEVGIYATGVNLTINANKVRNIRVGSSTGYGINVSGHYITVKDNDVAVARHCITSAERYYMSTNLTFSNNTVDCGPGAAPLDFHGNSSGTITGNKVTSTTPNIAGIMIRNSNTVVSYNTITMNNPSGTRVYGVAVSENGYNNVDITNNKVYFKGTAGAVCGVGDFSVVGTINDLRIANNYFQGGIGLNAAIGTGLHIDSNTFEGNLIYNPTINLNSTNIKEYYIEGNTFINNSDGKTFNYIISTTKSASSSGYIRNNTARNTNVANLYPQFRINNKHNVVENNVFYTEYDWPLMDYSNEKENLLTGNKRISKAGVNTPITYKSMPPATAWFYGKTISYTDSKGVTSQYKCVKSGTSSYSWQLQSTITT